MSQGWDAVCVANGWMIRIRHHYEQDKILFNAPQFLFSAVAWFSPHIYKQDGITTSSTNISWIALTSTNKTSSTNISSQMVRRGCKQQPADLNHLICKCIGNIVTNSWLHRKSQFFLCVCVTFSFLFVCLQSHCYSSDHKTGNQTSPSDVTEII